jgi:hypothetical protein
MCVIETRRSKEAEIVAEPLFGTDQATGLLTLTLRGFVVPKGFTGFHWARVYTYVL